MYQFVVEIYQNLPPWFLFVHLPYENNKIMFLTLLDSASDFFSLVLQVLFYDWLLYNPASDSIMLIEPGVLLLFHSLLKHPAVTVPPLPA